MSLGELLERTAKSRGPLDLSILSIVGAFLLLLLSQILGLATLTYKADGIEKQVGFLWSPNWSIMYLVLLPLYLCLFAILAERREYTLRSFLQARIIIGPNGASVSEEHLFGKWRKVLARISVALWALLIAVIIQTTSEWVSYCLVPLLKGDLGKGTVDWSTISILMPSEVNQWNAIVFSGVAYLYMGFALFIYLAVLVYAASFAWFLNSIGDPTGDFRLILRDTELGNRLSDIAMNIYACIVLGFCAFFLMRLEAKYLQSDHRYISDLWFNDVRLFIDWLRRDTPISSDQTFRKAEIPSEWTSLTGIVFTLLMLFSVVYLLYEAFEKAREYYLDHVEQPDWRATMNITYDEGAIKAIRSQAFLGTVFPNHLHLGIIILGSLLSCLFVGVGSIGIATLLYAGLQLGVLPALKKRTSNDMQDRASLLHRLSHWAPSRMDQSPYPFAPWPPGMRQELNGPPKGALVKATCRRFSQRLENSVRRQT